MRTFKRMVLLVFFMALVALVLLFLLENQQPVALNMFGWTLPALPVALFVILAFVVGLIIGPVLGGCMRLRHNRRSA